MKCVRSSRTPLEKSSRSLSKTRQRKARQRKFSSHPPTPEKVVVVGPRWLRDVPGGDEGDRACGLALISKISLAKVTLYYMIYALKFFHCLLFALIPRLSDWVPALGIHPGTRGVGNFTLPGAVCSPHRPPAFCACRHWASRTRAGSLLPGAHVPHLSFI